MALYFAGRQGWIKTIYGFDPTGALCGSGFSRELYQLQNVALSSPSCLAKSPASAIHGSGVRWAMHALPLPTHPGKFVEPWFSSTRSPNHNK